MLASLIDQTAKLKSSTQEDTSSLNLISSPFLKNQKINYLGTAFNQSFKKRKIQSKISSLGYFKSKHTTGMEKEINNTHNK